MKDKPKQIEQSKTADIPAPMPIVTTKDPQTIINKIRLDYVEKQVEVQTSTLKDGNTNMSYVHQDMSSMYSNHLTTISIIMALITLIIFIYSTIAHRANIKSLDKVRNIDNAIDDKMKKIGELDERINAASEESNKNDKALEGRLKELHNNIKAEHYLSEANNYYLEGKKSRAMNKYYEAMKTNPKLAAAYYNKGIIYHKDEEYDEAIKLYDTAIKIKKVHHDKIYLEAIYSKACAHCLLDERKEAITFLTNVIEIDAKYKETAYEDDDFAALRDNPEFRKLVESDHLDKSYSAVLYNKARDHATEKTPAEKSIISLEECIKIDDKYAKMAHKDEGFKSLKNNPKFRELVGLDNKE